MAHAHTITRSHVDSASVGARFRVKGDDAMDGLWTKSDASTLTTPTGETLPLSTIYGWADQEMLIAYDRNTWTPGELRVTRGRPWNEGDAYLVVADHANTSYTWCARLSNGIFLRWQEIGDGAAHDWTPAPIVEGMTPIFALLRSLLRQNPNVAHALHEDAKVSNTGFVTGLQDVADEVEDDRLDTFLAGIGHPRPGLIATVSVVVKGVHTMTPSFGDNIEAEPVQVPVKYKFTYEAVGKGCQCRQADRGGVDFDTLVQANGPGDVTDIEVEVSCTHDE